MSSQQSPRMLQKIAPLPLSYRRCCVDFWDGRVHASPVASPEHIACADDGDPVFELELFLQAYLPTIPPSLIARFPLPPETYLLEIAAPLKSEHLPERLRVPISVRFACVVVPLPRSLWVIIPTLQQHTFFVAPDEPLEQTIRDEIKRMVAARELNSVQFLKMLPGSTHELRWLSLSLDRQRALTNAAQARTRQRVLAKHAQKLLAIKVLESVGVALHDQIDHDSPAPPFAHQDLPLRTLTALLGGKERSSILILGPTLAGKTALVRAWLWNVLRAPKNKSANNKTSPVRVYSLSGAQLMAGMSGLGQWQARALRIMQAAETLDAILFFEDLRDLFAERSGSGVDLAGALKPFLEDNRVRLLATLSSDAFDRLERLHIAFFNCLQRLHIAPLTPAQTLDALRAWTVYAQKFQPHRPNLAPDAVPLIVDLLHRYQPYQAFPGKAVRFFDTLRTVHEARATFSQTITATDALDAFALQSGMPAFLLRDDQPLKLAQIMGHFRTKVIGQDEAITRLAHLLCTVKANLQPSQKPLATLLFVGPTGVGKTEVARALAHLLFSDATRMIRFDMSEYADASASSRLIHGTQSTEGLLTRQVRQQPFCVLLLDEIEKAHPSVFDLLLQVCGEGRLTDAQGRTAFFHNAIIIMTSNLGAAEQRQRLPGFINTSRAAESHYAEIVNRTFRPEFVNRIDRIVPFVALSPEQLSQVTALVSKRVASRRGLSELGIDLQISQAAHAALTLQGSDPLYGARALRRHLDHHLASPLARLLSAHAPDGRGATLLVAAPGDPPPPHQPLASIEHNGLQFSLLRARAFSQNRALFDLDTLSQTRRKIEQALRLPPIEQLQGRRQQLIADLNDLARRIKKQNDARNPDPRLSSEMNLLQSEFTDLDRLWSRTTSLLQNLHDSEELALLALFDSQDPAPFTRDALVHARDLQHHLVHLLLAQIRARDAISVLLQEHDDGPTLSLLILPLINAAATRKWTLSFHLNSDAPSQTPHDPWPANWPTDCSWGPPRDPSWIINWLQTQTYHPTRCVVVSVQGAYAGALLALCAGLHRWHNPPATLDHTHNPPDQAHLTFTPLAMRASFTPKDFESKHLVPPAPIPAADLAKLKPAREYFEDHLIARPPIPLPPPTPRTPSAPPANHLSLRFLRVLGAFRGDRAATPLGA